MKARIYIFFLIFCIIFLFFKTVRAEIPIWRIGDPNVSYFSEFACPETEIIEYNVPLNWESLLDQNIPYWSYFPKFLYPFGDPENVPQEIRINFDYPEDFISTTLIIRATTVFEDVNIRLEIFKGEGFSKIGEKHIDFQKKSNFYDFPLGSINKGLHVENRIIIRSRGPFNIPICFDNVSFYSDDISLDPNDSDRDGVIDIDEGDEYSLDKASVCIPIRGPDPNSSDESYDPDSSDIKKILLRMDVKKLEGATPGFREVKFLDSNALDLPEWLRTDRFFPYGFLGFRAEEIKPYDKIAIQISTMGPYVGQQDQLYPFACFYTYQDSNNWEETDFDFLDRNTARILLIDGGEGDFDGEKDGNINTRLGISYPRTIDVHVEKRGCFIKTITQGRDHGKVH